MAYTKKTWVSGETITKEALNNIEDGLSTLDKNQSNFLTEHQDISGKADKTELHNHSNKSVLDNITSTKITEWNNKSNLALGTTSSTAYRGDYGNVAYTHSQSAHAPSNAQKNSDITKAEIEAKLTGNITTHTHNQYLTQHQDLSHLALKSELHNHSNKSVLDGITSAKVTEWNSKSTFSGSYNDLTNKPTIPSLNGYATKQYVDNAINTLSATNNSVKSYVVTEAQMIADKVIEKRNAYSLVISSMSDLHTNGTDESATGVLHAFQAINEIDKVTPVDLAAIHGDVMVGYMTDEDKGAFKYVRTCMNEITKNIPIIHMQGNHDDLNSDTTAIARQKYFRYIGANNEGVVTDFANRFRNYGYKDFDDLRIRFIYLNSADASEAERTSSEWITPMQFNWFINTALDFSDKEGSEDWHFIVTSHHPLNASGIMTYLLDILKAYTNKSSGSFDLYHLDVKHTISYNFANVKQKLICHLHGHTHNFRTEWFDDVLSITVPNACYGRNNEYGTHSSYSDEIREKFGDVDENGVQRQFNKISNSASDTAFVTFVIDSRVNNKIYAYCYGAGIDREIDLTTKEVLYIEKSTDVPEKPEITVVPEEVLRNTNLVTTSIDSDGSIYNGIGYKNGYYISSEGGGLTSHSSRVVTGFIEKNGYDYYMFGAKCDLSGTGSRVALYDESFNYLGIYTFNSITVTNTSDGIYKITTPAGTTFNNAKYVRFCFDELVNDLYVYVTTETVTNTYTNLIPTSIDTDGTIFNGVGYRKGYRVNSSGNIVEADNMCISGLIPIKPYQTIRLKNITYSGSDTTYIVWYNADKSYQLINELNAILPYDSEEDMYVGNSNTRQGWFRISCGGIDSTTILTVDEEINDDNTSNTPEETIENLIVMPNRTYESYSSQTSNFIEVTVPHELDVNKYYPAVSDGRVGKYCGTKITHTVDTTNNGFAFSLSSSTGYGLLFPIEPKITGEYIVTYTSFDVPVIVHLVEYNANNIYKSRTQVTGGLGGDGQQWNVKFNISDISNKYALFFSYGASNTNKTCTITNLSVSKKIK